MATTILTATYQELAADVTALNLIQVRDAGSSSGSASGGAELVAASSLPAATVDGVQLHVGGTMSKAQVATDLGTSGKLYGRLFNRDRTYEKVRVFTW